MFIRIVLSALFLILAMAPARQAAAAWMTFQHDSQHSSQADVAGPSEVGIKWSYQHPDNGSGSAFTAGIAVGPDGTLYTGGEDGRAYALNPNGSVKYIYEGVGLCCAPPVVDNEGTIYFSGNGLYALNPDFTLKWFYPDGGNCCGAVTVGPDGTIYVGNGWLHALDPNPAQFIDPVAKTVAARWVAEFGNWSAAVSLYNTALYVQDMTTLYAVDPADGSLKWSLPVCNDLETSPVMDNNENVYIADCEKLIAVNPSLVGPGETTPPPAAVRTVLDIPGKQFGMMAYDGRTTVDGRIAALAYGFTVDPETGAKIWNADGELYAINPVANSLLWQQPISGSYGNPYSPSPVIDARGVIYVASNDYDSYDGVDYMTHVYSFIADETGTPLFHYATPLMYHSDIRVPAIGDGGDLYVLMDGAVKDFAPVADLSVSVTASPSPVNAGGVITYTTTVSNLGPDNAKKTVMRQTLPAAVTVQDVQPAACTLNGKILTCNFGDVASESVIVVTVTAQAPAYGTTVTTVASVLTDSSDQNSTNNSVTLPVVVQARDLVETAVSNPPATVRRGYGFSVTDTEKNQGNASTTGSNVVRYYLSIDGSAKTTLLTGTRTVAVLGANQVSTGTRTVTVPSSTTVGVYSLLACGDDTGLITENNSSGTAETNNCRASATTVNVTN